MQDNENQEIIPELMIDIRSFKPVEYIPITDTNVNHDHNSKKNKCVVEWIKFSEKLPEKYESIFMYKQGMKRATPMCFYIPNFENDPFRGDQKDYTHWCSLPELPKE